MGGPPVARESAVGGESDPSVTRAGNASAAMRAPPANIVVAMIASPLLKLLPVYADPQRVMVSAVSAVNLNCEA
jgi:hypothetical protein